MLLTITQNNIIINGQQLFRGKTSHHVRYPERCAIQDTVILRGIQCNI